MLALDICIIQGDEINALDCARVFARPKITHKRPVLTVGFVQYAIIDAQRAAFQIQEGKQTRCTNPYLHIVSSCRKRVVLSWEMPMTSAKRQQLPYLGSPTKNPMYIGNVQRAVAGRVIFLIMVRFPVTCIWVILITHIVS
jgi:hypothetical protein